MRCEGLLIGPDSQLAPNASAHRNRRELRTGTGRGAGGPLERAHNHPGVLPQHVGAVEAEELVGGVSARQLEHEPPPTRMHVKKVGDVVHQAVLYSDPHGDPDGKPRPPTRQPGTRGGRAGGAGRARQNNTRLPSSLPHLDRISLDPGIGMLGAHHCDPAVILLVVPPQLRERDAWKHHAGVSMSHF